MNSKMHEIASEVEKRRFEATGQVYHPIPFPEFDHITTSTSRASAYRKWRLIERFLGCGHGIEGEVVLDVGASAGFYAFNFAKVGAKVDAYEPHEHYVDIGRRIADATGLAVRWHNAPLEEGDLSGKKYGVALMLSVFQWVSHGNENLTEACRLLRAVAASSRILFFELGCNQGKSAVITDEKPIAWIWRLLQEETAPKHIAFLGTTKAWGRKRRYVFVCADEMGSLTAWQRLVTWALQRRWLR